MYGQKYGRTFGEAAQNREEQEWAKEEPKLDNASKTEEEFTLSIQMTKSIQKFSKTQRRKLERLTAPAMPCNMMDKQHPCIAKANAKPKIAFEKNTKTMCGCVVASHEFTRQRAESSQSKNREDHIAGKGLFSMSHSNLAHKFIPMPQAMKIPDAKAAVDRMEEARDNPSMETGDCQEQKRGFLGSTKREKESLLCHFDGHMSPQECGVWNQNSRNYKRQSRAPW